MCVIVTICSGPEMPIKDGLVFVLGLHLCVTILSGKKTVSVMQMGGP